MIYQIIGVIVIGLLLVFIGLFILYTIFRRDVRPLITESEMPVLQPLPIPTFNRTFIMRVLVWIFDVRKWRLVENWHFKLKEDTEIAEIVLPKDFLFDGASIPRIFWFILSPVGLLMIPGLIHDYGYRYNQLWQKQVNGNIEPYMKEAGRKAWDDLFKTVGEQVNGFAGIDMIAWLGLRLGGWLAWWGHRRRNETPVPPEPDST
jgi:hypothetical protein